MTKVLPYWYDTKALELLKSQEEDWCVLQEDACSVMQNRDLHNKKQLDNGRYIILTHQFMSRSSTRDGERCVHRANKYISEKSKDLRQIEHCKTLETQLLLGQL